MTVTELTKEIYEKYPNVWEKFILNYIPEYEYHSELTFYPENNLSLKNCDDFIPLPFTFLYGLLEDFFEENGIIIQIEKIIYDYEHPFPYIIRIYENKITHNYCGIPNQFESKTEAKQAAILKACEIMNNQLKE